MAAPGPGRGSGGRARPALTVAALLAQARGLDPRDAGALLAEVLQRPRSWLAAHPEAPVGAEAAARFRGLAARRLDGTPLAYLLARQGFWTLELEVSEATLIPRPDTECLLEHALERLPADRPQRVLDLGTGSGAIALALASERPLARVLGVDRSLEALAVAARNATGLGIDNVRWLAASWADALAAGAFDVVVCNPPYLAATDPHLADPELQAEPREALVAGRSGLEDLDHVITAARPLLRREGWLLVEHGYDQQRQVLGLFGAADYRHLAAYRDLGGNPRVVAGRRPAR